MLIENGKEKVRPMKTCKDCKWWDAESYKDETTQKEYENNPDGYCRRFPPNKDKKFPLTYPIDWCGEFIAKTKH